MRHQYIIELMKPRETSKNGEQKIQGQLSLAKNAGVVDSIYFPVNHAINTGPTANVRVHIGRRTESLPRKAQLTCFLHH